MMTFVAVCLEVTLAIIKPHAVKSPHACKGIRNIILENGFQIVKSRTKLISKDQVEKFYEEHSKQFFYNRLVTSMMSGESDIYILARENAVQHWRKLMGPTKVYQAIYTAPVSVRSLYGLTDTRNATHGSDSRQSAAREIAVFFPEFNSSKWLEENGSGINISLPTIDTVVGGNTKANVTL